jgi:type IV pilus assembly protein PilN
MTTTVERQRDTGKPPGWGIHADLLPPEVLSSRRLKAVRRSVITVCAAFVALMVLLYPLAMYKNHTAAADRDEQLAAQSALVAQKASYANVTSLVDQINLIAGQVSLLMVADVDVPDLLRTIRVIAPPEATLTALQLSVDPTGASAGLASTAGSSLDTSGESPIGALTINGTSTSFGTAADYVTALAKLTGVVDAQPQSNSFDGHVYTFTIGATLTDAQLSGRYRATAGGN